MTTYTYSGFVNDSGLVTDSSGDGPYVATWTGTLTVNVTITDSAGDFTATYTDTGQLAIPSVLGTVATETFSGTITGNIRLICLPAAQLHWAIQRRRSSRRISYRSPRRRCSERDSLTASPGASRTCMSSHARRRSRSKVPSTPPRANTTRSTMNSPIQKYQ
jgi:hypothetical protein